MLKFIRGKGQQPSAERQKLQRELFAFRKTVHHGFPNKPTCLAWDPVMRLMAFGTTSGAIKVFGQPGVEFYGQHTASEVSVIKVIFIPNKGRLVTLCEDNSLHLWEINDNSMEEIKSHTMEGKLKKVSAMCLEGSEEHLLLGTEGGNIYLLNLTTFEPSDTIIYQDVVIHNVPEGYKINPGAVEAIAVQPGSPENVLIGYNRGLIVLWNITHTQTEESYISTQGVESVHWCSKEKFMSSHNDGCYTIWKVDSPNPVQNPCPVYGPFPCRAITKIVTVQSPKGNEEMLVFSGGLQRGSFSDKHTISVLDGDNHVVFDFTSKVIDFFVASSGETHVLIVLAEEEIVALELDGDEWPMLELPYLVSLHASAVTCSTYVSDIPQSLWDSILAAGQKQAAATISSAAWPVDGGNIGEGSNTLKRDILLTGHEDGSVRVWEAGGVAMKPLYRFSSSQVMCPADEDCPDADDSHDNDEWPPFKKVGSFDPYSDDPRLAVKKVTLCPITGTLAVAGTAGHIIVARLTDDKEPPQIKVTTMNIVSSRDGFVWKGHEALKLRTTPTVQSPIGGFAACAVLQLHPPAAVTALALHSGWGLVAAGTAHGVALYDYLRNAHVALKCTLNPNDLSGTGDAPISRRKSFKKSLRESFRRLRKGRSQRQEAKRATSTATSSTPPRPSPAGEGVETKPVERAVEARPVDDALGSMVRCLTFARTYIISVQNMTPTLWTGTNNGTVYVFTIAIPGGSKRTEESVSCQLGKEIQLKHRAPVIGISLIDGLCHSVDTSRGEDHPPPHKVLICSEEQIKVFTVPALKPVCKLKLTAGEGARVRRTGLARFKAGNHTETCLLVLTNLGDVVVLSLPDLRRQINVAVARREDINGISSLAFTEDGEALYLHSSSELERVTVSASRATIANCWLELPPGSRPPPPLTNASSTSSSSNSSSSSSSASSDDDDSHHSTHGKTEEKPNTATKEVTEIKENGVSDSVSGHDVTLSSVGDITIDSVKDHLTNNVANIEESRTVLTETKLESTVESVVVKTTVITNETTHITSPPTEST